MKTIRDAAILGVAAIIAVIAPRPALCEPAVLNTTEIERLTPDEAKARLREYAERLRAADSSNAVTTGLSQQIRITTLQNMQLSQAVALQKSVEADKLASEVDDAHKQSSSCRALTKVQTAFAGGIALKPAPYGVTYVSIAQLVVPIFFPNCDAVAPSKPQESTTTVTLRQQMQLTNAQLSNLLNLMQLNLK